MGREYLKQFWFHQSFSASA